MYNIAIIGGDGIGNEVMESAEYLLDKLDTSAYHADKRGKMIEDYVKSIDEYLQYLNGSG